MSRNIRGPITLFVVGAAADQMIKFAVRQWLTKPVPLIGDFACLDLAHNFGFSFSLGSGMPAAVRIVLQLMIPLAVVSFAAVRLFRGWPSSVEAYGLAAYCAGAVGNWIDRVFLGYVVDFLRIRTYGLFGLSYWPTMNLADLLISTGAALFIISQFLPAPKTLESIKPEDENVV